ncbi:MAG: carbohydrate kinase [Actinomycetaceae bacterium]|nr:carbohydrate kinase [Actinomycetaceae bacterium]MDY5854316.1 carbohydrate kinase [Arcanobacterium sp.]
MNMLVIGEALIDVIYDAQGTLIGRYPGGSPLNVAVGLSRLGRETALLTRIGDDAPGDVLVDHLGSSNVSLVKGSVSTEPTSMAYAHVDERGHANYDFDIRSSFPAPPTDPVEREQLLADAPRHVHIGSIGAHLMPGAETVREWLTFYHGTSTISYDPNVRIGLAGTADEYRQQIEQYATMVDVLKASIEDLELCYGQMDEKALRDLAHHYLNSGVSLVVLTEGSRGLNLFTADHTIHADSIPVDVVDTVGAGDSLTSALIDGLARLSVLGRTDVERIRQQSASLLTSLGTYCATAAGITVTRAGANPPTRREISAHSYSYAVEGSIF